jgi:SAM-dependent methyltransferase
MPEEKDKSIVDQSYYDESYFTGKGGGKKAIDPNTGEEKEWSYRGTDWTGHYFIINGLLRTFDGEIGSILDVGAGQGSFTDYAIRAGLRAKGYDYSEWAVANPLNLAKGHLFQADATDLKEEDNSWDLVYCSDMVEHIDKSKISKVIAHFYRITRRWVFLQFPCPGVGDVTDIFDAEKQDINLFPHYKLSGHVNMSPRPWWDELFQSFGFKVRDDLVQVFRDNTPPAVLTNWFNIVILEK